MLTAKPARRYERADSPRHARPARPAGPGSPAARRDRGYRRLTVAAFVLVVGGLAAAGGTGWDWWSRVHRIEASQVRLAHAVDAQWARDAATPGTAGTMSGTAGAAGAAVATGADGAGALARLHIPRLRLNLVVVEGDADAALLRGPGHIPDTPMFGEPGNVGVAGHRYPGVFWDLDLLREGDPIVVETRDQWFAYRVSRELIVGPQDVDVLAAHPAGAPAGADQFLTLVTCDPVFTTLHRLIRQAVLVRATPRADGAPPELAGGRKSRPEGCPAKNSGPPGSCRFEPR
jgi:sortase A